MKSSTSTYTYIFSEATYRVIKRDSNKVIRSCFLYICATSVDRCSFCVKIIVFLFGRL